MRIAVVIPTLNEAAHLPRLLADLAGEDLIAAIIVSDGGSTDGTVELARAAGARVIGGGGPPGRGAQIARGVAEAESAFVPEWLWLLHADSRLPPDWPRRVASLLDHPDTAWYGRLRFTSDDPRARLLEAGVALRCAAFRLPYGDQSLLIRPALLRACGGVPDLPLMEDVLLARRLRRYLRPMPLVIRTDAAAYERDGWLRRAGRNLWLLTRFLRGAEVARLARAYRR